MKDIIERSKTNIITAIEDYGRYSNDTSILDDISDEFIERLAEDNAESKKELRELFSQSPAWNEELDALVINGTRTHNPDYGFIADRAYQILSYARELDSQAKYDICDFFSQPDNATTQERGIAAIKKIAPKAYAPGKKLSRVFKAVCVALGIADESPGSDFQRYFAEFADELTSKKISFKLFVSLNPAHFLTMSNPKRDRRGTTLTSCHSLDSTEYDYNNGCSGYARDKYTFIVFTVADPTVAETLNNRKTTRQIFAYKPGNGILMQSRFYNTSGGTRGAVEDSKLYRDLVQREISMLENVPNLWKTYPYLDRDKEYLVHTGEGFGGYADWTYQEFDGKVSIRADHELGHDSITVGTYGLCICCGEEIRRGLYCGSCISGHRSSSRGYCDDCEELYDTDDLYTVYDSSGSREVCYHCRDDHYRYCDHCDTYYDEDGMYYVGDHQYCPECYNELCFACEDCSEDCYREDMVTVVMADGERRFVCSDCADNNYNQCQECGEFFEDDGSVSCPACGVIIRDEEDEEAV